ncbi:MAG: hypothetical protein AAGD01_00380 [Acidobacteriota bacterium]
MGVATLLMTLLLAFAPGAATAEPARTALLDSEGRIYEILEGRYGDLFPEGQSAPVGRSVLALRLTEVDGEVRQLLVPGTADTAWDRGASLVLDAPSDSVYVLWESRSSKRSLIRVRAFDHEVWRDPISVRADHALVGSPRLRVTRDRYLATTDNRTVRRTVLHVFWAEEAQGNEGEKVRYAPLVLRNGRWVGDTQIVDLAALDPNPDKGAQGPDLSASLVVVDGSVPASVVVGFFNPGTGRLLTAEAQVIPGGVGSLARTMRQRVIDEAAGTAPGDLEALGQVVGNMVIEIGRHQFHDSLVNYMAAEVHAAVVAAGNGSSGPGGPGIVLEALGDLVGNMVIEIGSSYFGRDVLHRKVLPATPTMLYVGAGVEDDAGPLEGDSDPHLVAVRLISDLTIPKSGQQPDLIVSGDGAQVAVVWEEQDGLRYRESEEGAAWSEAHVLLHDDDQDLERLKEMVRERIEGR